MNTETIYLDNTEIEVCQNRAEITLITSYKDSMVQAFKLNKQQANDLIYFLEKSIELVRDYEGE